MKAFYLLLFAFSGVASFVAAFHLRKNYSAHGAKSFSYMFLIIGLWSINSLMRIATSSKILTTFLLSLGGALGFASAFYWFKFATAYTGKTRWQGKKIDYFGLLFFIALVSVGFTNMFHHLMWADISPIYNGFIVFNVEKSMGHHISAIVGYTLYLSGLYYLGTLLRSSHNLPAVMLALLGAISLIASNALPYVVSIPITHGTTITPIGASIASGFAVAAVRNNLLKVTPIARQQVFREYSEPILVLDNTDHIVDYNKAFDKTFSATKKEAKNTKFKKVYPNLSQSSPPKHAEDSKQLIVETPQNTKQFTVKTSPIKVGPNTTGRIITFRDTTETERYLAEIRRQNRHLEEFADSAAHELRNPLTTLKGYAELVKTEAEEIEDKQQITSSLSSNAETVLKNATEMNGIASDLLKTIQAAKSIETVRPLDFQEVTQKAINQVDSELPSININSTGVIHADLRRLQLLLETTIETMAGRINSTDGQIEVELTEDGFILEDSGEPIDEELVDSIISYGFTTQIRNKGLGLSVAKTLAETHYWTLNIDTDYDGLRVVISNAKTELNTSPDEVETKKTATNRDLSESIETQVENVITLD